MGLLDDAIREHLDLKRRRGADPGEVERDERDALGPVRRNREASVASEPDGPGVANGLAYDHAGEEEDWSFEEADAHGEPEPAAEGAPAPGNEPVFDELARRRSAGDDELPPAPPPRFAQGAGAETAEYDVEGAMAADEDGGEDMLEETPEFLQDTPDHDRLWFEQRPPKDFDFDG